MSETRPQAEAVAQLRDRLAQLDDETAKVRLDLAEVKGRRAEVIGLIEFLDPPKRKRGRPAKTAPGGDLLLPGSLLGEPEADEV